MTEYSDNLTLADVEAVAILGQAVTFTAADGADHDGRVIQ